MCFSIYLRNANAKTENNSDIISLFVSFAFSYIKYRQAARHKNTNKEKTRAIAHKKVDANT